MKLNIKVGNHCVPVKVNFYKEGYSGPEVDFYISDKVLNEVLRKDQNLMRNLTSHVLIAMSAS